MSVPVPAPPQTNFVLVVTERITDLVCDNYRLQLFGLPCPPPRLDIVRDAAPGKVRVSWNSAYPDYGLQSVNSLSGSGPIGFINVTSPPVLAGGKFIHSNTVAVPRQFYRLAK